MTSLAICPCVNDKGGRTEISQHDNLRRCTAVNKRSLNGGFNSTRPLGARVIHTLAPKSEGRNHLWNSSWRIARQPRKWLRTQDASPAQEKQRTAFTQARLRGGRSKIVPFLLFVFLKLNSSSVSPPSSDFRTNLVVRGRDYSTEAIFTHQRPC